MMSIQNKIFVYYFVTWLIKCLENKFGPCREA